MPVDPSSKVWGVVDVTVTAVAAAPVGSAHVGSLATSRWTSASFVAENAVSVASSGS